MATPTAAFPLLLEKICQGHHLSQEQAYYQFKNFLEEKLCAIEITALLTALKAKGESPAEVLGVLDVLRQCANPFPMSQELKNQYTIVDCVGTGGDGQQSLNISTAAAFVLASLGVKVAKHGNRAVSSRCGSADLFEKLGVNIESTPQSAKKALEEVGLCFLYAPFYHPSIKAIREIRSTLKVKTLFNLLGPLLNPLQPDFLLVGVYDPKYCKLIADVLKTTAKRALVVHGEGLDEIAIHGKTSGFLLKETQITPFNLTPEEVDLPRYSLCAIKGQDVEYNAKACLDLLQGKGQAAYRASVAINVGAVLWLIDKANTLQAGVHMAQSVMNSSLAYEKLQHLIEVSHA
ncbi:MAG: anthranilate phosphoribosyltransferase [Proteobacteria bacterium]|nr:anthranilate phosphoribosyltransferase [Pseudomonadota bacterium]